MNIFERGTLSKGQERFLEAVLAGRNVFLTGKAGTGKSYITKEAMKILGELKKKVVAVAPTGVAANNIGGQTIHSLFAITPAGIADFESTNHIRSEKRKLLSSIETLFIDEVSMLRPDILDAMQWTLRKNACEGLDKKQIIFIGDLKQLPPILDDNERSILFRKWAGEEFFHAAIYKKLEVEEIELIDIHRQSDPDFINALNKVRDGAKDEYFRRFVNSEPEGIILAPHNSTVNRYNEEGLKKQEGKLFTFDAKVSGNAKAEDFNMESHLKVKDGCKVMYLVNSKNNPLVNGTLGVFVVKDKKFFIQVGGVEYALDKHIHTKKQYVYNEAKDDLILEEIGTIEQYPIRLAYALSIHKSQGLTFEKITVDLSRPCFQRGQMYVALSRVKTPEGLRLIINR